MFVFRFYRDTEAYAQVTDTYGEKFGHVFPEVTDEE